MVSVLPAHIAFEMKTEMLKKTRKAQMKSLLSNDDLNYNNTRDSRSINRGESFKKSAISILDSAARKFQINKKLNHTNDASSFSNRSKLNEDETNTNNSSSMNQLNKISSLKKNGTIKFSNNTAISNSGGKFIDKSRPKASGFHDLHIKAHNNVT
jgi:hypothetical protein